MMMINILKKRMIKIVQQYVLQRRRRLCFEHQALINTNNQGMGNISSVQFPAKKNSIKVETSVCDEFGSFTKVIIIWLSLLLLKIAHLRNLGVRGWYWITTWLWRNELWIFILRATKLRNWLCAYHMPPNQILWLLLLEKNWGEDWTFDST